MLVATPSDLKAQLGPGQRLPRPRVRGQPIRGAVSDLTLFLPSPLSTARRTKFSADAGELARVVMNERIGGLVVGLPVNMDGSEGPRCQSVRQFVANLEARPEPVWRALPMLLWD